MITSVVLLSSCLCRGILIFRRLRAQLESRTVVTQDDRRLLLLLLLILLLLLGGIVSKKGALKSALFCRVQLAGLETAPGSLRLCVTASSTCLIFEPTCANAQWALRSRFPSVCLSVCLSVTGQKFLDRNYWTIIHISGTI